MELGIQEERDGAEEMDDDKSNGSGFGAAPMIPGGHQTTAD